LGPIEQVPKARQATLTTGSVINSLESILSLNFILKINDILFYKAFIPKEEFKIERIKESIKDEPTHDTKYFVMKIYLGKYFKNAEEVLKIYREKLSIQRDL